MLWWKTSASTAPVKTMRHRPVALEDRCVTVSTDIEHERQIGEDRVRGEPRLALASTEHEHIGTVAVVLAVLIGSRVVAPAADVLGQLAPNGAR